MRTWFFSLVISFNFCLSAHAQTCCSAGVPLSSFLEVSKGEDGSFSFQANYEYKSINLLVDNNRRLENDPRSRYGQTLAFRVDYSINSKWAVSAMLPFIHHSRNTISESQNSIGIGDPSILVKYNFLSSELYNLNAIGGVEFPFGSTSQRGNSQILLSPDMQSGSGSIDFMMGLAFIKEDFIFPYLSNLVSLSYRKNGTNDDFGSTSSFSGRSFAFGDEIVGSLGFKYTHTMASIFIIPDLGFRVRWAEPNEEQRIDAPNSGGRWLSLPFGVSFVPDQKKSFRLYCEVPLYQDLEGLQITMDFAVGVQFVYSNI